MNGKKNIVLALILSSILLTSCTDLTAGHITNPAQVTPTSQAEAVVTSSADPVQIDAIVTPVTDNTPSGSDTSSQQTSDVPALTATPTSVPAVTPTATATPTATSSPVPTSTPTSTPLPTDTPTPADSIGEMTVHFIDVGQGDCILIECDDEYMLIDAGDNNKGTAVQLYLQRLKIKDLKYFIVTHGDSDHSGGADVVITKFNIETLFMPEENKNTATYRDVLDAANYRSLAITRPVVGNTYTIGSASFTIVAPAKKYSGSNNNSIAIVLTHGNNRFLLTGDAEEASEADILKCGIDIDVDVYKAGHHGSNTASSYELLTAASPEYCVISCGEGNSYGHPHAETLNNLRALGIKVFRTDEQGSITVTSDGETLKWNASPTESWLAGER